MSKNVKTLIAKTFEEIAQGLETGQFGGLPRIAVLGIGSEHGEANMLEGALAAVSRGCVPVFIGNLTDPRIQAIPVANEAEAIAKMEQGLQNGDFAGAVAMHYPFPIGTATVGRVITPAAGRPMFIATTTGTADTDRVAGMVKNAIYGIICAKSCGITRPTVGILNIDGARQTERALKELAANGYSIDFAASDRADGGNILRGNDILRATCDILVCDPLTGNVLMKLLSSFTTGGNYEALGFGYGPGIGADASELVMIVSRASGAPVVANAIEYAAQLVRGDWKNVAKAEFAAAKAAGLDALLRKIAEKSAPAEKTAIAPPPKEIVTGEISGIEITDLEDAVQSLWKAEIYAESGMGCTGPVVLVHEQKLAKAREILVKDGWIGNE
ncbi:MAG: glycine/sarcosine/betaine reductase complex component C subunit alpha [Defluviitaleaceae bacterium]|nr:glycine/sarcosine/betaine reductase complex component C subunit alpha [Defluviitaleaceae bacterium]